MTLSWLVAAHHEPHCLKRPYASGATQATIFERLAMIHRSSLIKSLVVVGVTAIAMGIAHADKVETELYTVEDGVKVDEKTYEGFKTWRSAACDRCHGANQEGLVGPSLVNSLKVLTKEEFIATVRDGRLAKGMQSFGSSEKVMSNIDALYAYLKGRSDGAITQAKVSKM